MFLLCLSSLIQCYVCEILPYCRYRFSFSSLIFWPCHVAWVILVPPGITNRNLSLEGMMLKLKLQYFGHLMRRVHSLERLWCWEGLGTRGGEDGRGWDGWMTSLTWWTWVWVNSGSWWWTGRPEWLNWTEWNDYIQNFLLVQFFYPLKTTTHFENTSGIILDESFPESFRKNSSFYPLYV